MSKHLEMEIENLKKRILALSADGRGQRVQGGAGARGAELGARRRGHRERPGIDDTEVTIEEECLKVLALHQPVAGDLRFIVAILKINNDLERMGDLAVNVAERAKFLATRERPDVPLDLPLMADKTKAMMKKSLDALMKQNARLAYEVLEADDEIDSMNRDMYARIQDAIRKKPEHLESLIHLLSCSRHLERIADHATNIAEDVIYMIDGVIVRHRAEEYRAE